MATAESPAPSGSETSRSERTGGRGRWRRGHSPDPARRWIWAGLAIVLGGGLALRLWGVRQGLPYAYNVDEGDHFVPHAVRMFEEGTLNPHYFANPPAFTYVLHYLFYAWYGSSAAVVHAYSVHPADLYTLARVAAAVLGALALWFTYIAGARLFGRAAGLLAAAIEAVAFLPVFYAHLALNDVPTLAPLTLSLLGSAGVLRRGRVRDHVLAGIGLGLACATKYTAGVILLPYLVAAGGRLWDSRRAGLPRELAGVAAMALCALAAFLIANPYSLLDYSAFHGQLQHQSSLSAESQGKLGAPKQGGLLYYLWSLTWGLGWIPALAAARRRGAGVAPRAARGADDRPGRRRLPAVHGHRGALLRALADADPADPQPARGVRRARGAGRAALAAAAFSHRSGRAEGRGGSRGVRRAGGRRPRGPVRGAGAAAAPRARAHDRRGGARRARAARAGARREHPFGPRALARRHTHPDARLDGREHPAWGEGRRRARLARPVGARRTGRDPGLQGQQLPLVQVALALHVHRRGRGTRRRPPPRSQHRGLRAYALARADRALRAAGLLLGRDRVHRGRPRRSRPWRGAARDRLLPRARRPGRRCAAFLAVHERQGAGGVQLRLELRLLPARHTTGRGR